MDAPSITPVQLHELKARRLRLSQPNDLQSRLNHWFRYFRFLSQMEPHYTIPLEQLDLRDVYYTKTDFFRPVKTDLPTTVRSEKMAAVFNIGATYSLAAALTNCETLQGLNGARKAFQNAAASFQYFLERFEGAEFDVSSEFISLLETLLLANAEECFLDRVLIAAKSHNSCSQVARQVGLYYEKALHAITTPPLHQPNNMGQRRLVALLTAKASKFYAQSGYHYSILLRQNEEIGEEIARLQMALVRLLSTKSNIGNILHESSLVDDTLSLEENITEWLVRAKDINSSYYRKRIPPPDSLNELPTYNPESLNPLEILVALGG